MESFNKMCKNIIVIMIAHRLSEIKDCDKFFLLENGQIKAEGNYDFLFKSNDEFKSFTIIH